MSEDAGKRRLRESKRRFTATLVAQGYRVSTFDCEPFHLLARKGRQAKAIRICFGYTETDDILSVSREPMPDRCRREIWQIADGGRTIVIVKIKGLQKAKEQLNRKALKLVKG